MKSCDEMVNSLFERREQYNTEQKRKRTVRIRIASSIGCVCLVALIGFGLWQGGVFGATPPITMDDSVVIGEKDYIGPDEPHDDTQSGDEKKIIASAEADKMDSASYATPDNGTFYFSIPLRNAMDQNKDKVLYRVCVNIFSDNEMLPADSQEVKAECDRLSENGYTIVTYGTSLDTEASHYYFTVDATYDQLTEFTADENYGYFMFFGYE